MFLLKEINTRQTLQITQWAFLFNSPSQPRVVKTLDCMQTELQKLVKPSDFLMVHFLTLCVS